MISEKVCGASYCPVKTTATVSSEVEASSVTMLVVIYIGFSVAAALSVFFFLDRIQQKENKKHATLLASITSTCSLFKDPRMCLLIPISIFYGLQQGFVFGDFTKVSQPFNANYDLLLLWSFFCLLAKWTLHKKWSFPLKIFSVNVAKSAVPCGFGHIYWRNP